MIFFFSGTGNSLQIARYIAGQQGESLISIADAVNSKSPGYEYNLKDNETIGFVYPVYAWAPPKMVLEFVQKLKFKNLNRNYIFSVATCGDNIGNTMKALDKALAKSGLKLDSGFSTQMPNNYIISFDVDPKELEKRKLGAAEEAMAEISGIIGRRERNIFKTVKGFMPGLLTSVANPLFNSFAIRPERFFSNDSCTGCGICEKVCNCRNVKVNGKPQWGNNCSQCLACLHYCPVKAVQYGKGTGNKGRYKNPNVSIGEMTRK